VNAQLPQQSTGIRVPLKSTLGGWLRDHSLIARRLLWRLGDRPSRFVLSYLAGLHGIEIGGSAHNDYRLNAVNVDRFGEENTIYKEEEWRTSGRRRPVDIVAPGEDLPFGDDATDFVFASHVLEHFPDPIRALKEWLRVARKYVVLVIPHRDRTFDADRELTPVSELLRRHEQRFEDPRDLHWSVWTLESFLELSDSLGLRVIDALDPDDKVGNGFVVVLDAQSAVGGGAARVSARE
jgi:SAM-dependent methyltransferase